MIRVLSTNKAAANNLSTKGPLTWDALQNMGIPISYEAFARRWDSQDPKDQRDVSMLKSLVKNFDGTGLELKTHDTEARPEVGEKSNGEVSKMAKRATKLGK